MGMTTEEAIEIIESLYVTMSMWLGSSEEARQRNEAIKMAVDALKKQIPMKPILCDDEDLICPTCGADVEWKYYCEECGQKIDHDHEEE